MNMNVVKIIGLLATILGVGGTIVTDWVNDKKIEDKINRKVDEALAEREENEEEES